MHLFEIYQRIEPILNQMIEFIHEMTQKQSIKYTNIINNKTDKLNTLMRLIST